MVYGFPEVHYKNWKSEHKLEGHWLPIYSMNIFAIVNIIKVTKMPLYIVHFIKKYNDLRGSNRTYLWQF